MQADYYIDECLKILPQYYPAKLLKDVTSSEIIQIVSETPLHLALDLNGKTLTSTAECAINLKSANSSLEIMNTAEPIIYFKIYHQMPSFVWRFKRDAISGER